MFHWYLWKVCWCQPLRELWWFLSLFLLDTLHCHLVNCVRKLVCESHRELVIPGNITSIYATGLSNHMKPCLWNNSNSLNAYCLTFRDIIKEVLIKTSVTHMGCWGRLGLFNIMQLQKQYMITLDDGCTCRWTTDLFFRPSDNFQHAPLCLGRISFRILRVELEPSEIKQKWILF